MKTIMTAGLRANYSGFLQPGLGTIDQLRAYPTRKGMHRTLCLVTDEDALYWFDADSTDTDNGTTRIEPATGDGCWKLVEQIGGAGSGDVVSTGQAGGQSVQGSSNATGTLTLSSGSAEPIAVDGDLEATGTVRAAYVETGDLIMRSDERCALWRFVEHREYIEVRNEVTGRVFRLGLVPESLPKRVLRRIHMIIKRFQ